MLVFSMEATSCTPNILLCLLSRNYLPTKGIQCVYFNILKYTLWLTLLEEQPSSCFGQCSNREQRRAPHVYVWSTYDHFLFVVIRLSSLFHSRSPSKTMKWLFGTIVNLILQFANNLALSRYVALHLVIGVQQFNHCFRIRNYLLRSSYHFYLPPPRS